MNFCRTIPIENVYYLFCYAWDRIAEAKAIGTGVQDSPDLPNLLAKVLLAGTNNLLRRGLDRDYQEACDILPTVRGRIELSGTIMQRAKHAPRLVCEYDELSRDVLHNRVLKASILRLARSRRIESRLAHDLELLGLRLADVSDIRLSKSDFRRIRLHRNNAYYDLVLKVAELSFDCLLPQENGRGFSFFDVLEDERKMAGVFEAFVRNFYRLEQDRFSVLPLEISWDAEPLVEAGIGKLPRMVTDVFLTSPSRKIIIDTKYYRDALQTNWGARTFHSGNLYQLFAYLKNALPPGASPAEWDGMLLYPQTRDQLDACYMLQGHQVQIATVDLAQSWQDIEARLLSLLDRPDADEA